MGGAAFIITQLIRTIHYTYPSMITESGYEKTLEKIEPNDVQQKIYPDIYLSFYSW
jgi:hypothetical protein